MLLSIITGLSCQAGAGCLRDQMRGPLNTLCCVKEVRAGFVGGTAGRIEYALACVACPPRPGSPWLAISVELIFIDELEADARALPGGGPSRCGLKQTPTVQPSWHFYLKQVLSKLIQLAMTIT
jgi:hypothetical protein